MKKVSTSFWVKLTVAPFAMFAFSYAMVPLYDVLCEVTGFSGKTGRISINDVNATVIDETRKVKVEFVSMTMSGFEVDFKPEVPNLKVIPGKVYQTNFIAYNNTNKMVRGQAIPSVTPPDAALNFKKIECFCFTSQTFKPKTKVVMPVIFIVRADLDEKVKDITLSYNFFKLKDKE